MSRRRGESVEDYLVRILFPRATADAKPCIRGCTVEVDGEEQPRPAKKGLLCGSCYGRILYRLAEAPKIIVALRSAMVSLKAQKLEGRVDGTRDPQLPFFDTSAPEADAFWDAIVRWAGEHAAHLTLAGYTNLALPEPVERLVAFWEQTGAQGEARTVPPARGLRGTAQQMSDVCMWLRRHGEKIAHLDTVSDYHDAIVRTVARYRARAGLVPPRQRVKARPCPVCMETTVEVSSPDVGPMAARCTNCHQV